MEATSQVTFGAHDAPEFFDVLFHRSADDGVAVVLPLLHFGSGIAKACGDLVLGLGSATAESAGEFLKARRHDEDIG